MKKLILCLSILLTGCAGQVKQNEHTYDYNKSLAQNIMQLSSPTPFNLKDISAPIPSEYHSESYGYELAYASMGAANNLSSLADALSGAGAYGLFALAMPEVKGAKDRNLFTLLVKASDIENQTEDLEKAAFKTFTKQVFDIVKNNAQKVEKTLYGTNKIHVSKDQFFYDHWLAGFSSRVRFEDVPEESRWGDCPTHCSIGAREGRFYVMGPYSGQTIGLKSLDPYEEYYFLSYNNGMSTSSLLNPSSIYMDYFPDNFFFYDPNYAPDKSNLKARIPALFSKGKVHLFVTPKTIDVTSHSANL